jgi:uncharacterized protein YhhL (DUF1145 family)
MGEAASLLWLPAGLAAGALLARLRPSSARRVFHGLAGITCGVLGLIAVTGIAWEPGAVASVHRWGSAAVIIFEWMVLPLAAGFALASPHRRPVGRALSVLMLMALLGTTLLASLTGYLGPSRGDVDPMTLRRFRILHYGVFPALTVGLAVWWNLRAGRE